MKGSPLTIYLPSPIKFVAMSKIMKSIVISALVYGIPLWVCGKFVSCFSQYQFALLFLFTALIQISQPDVTLPTIKKNITTDKYSTLYIYVAGLGSQILAVVEWTLQGIHSLQLNWVMFAGLVFLLVGFYVRVVSRTMLNKNFTSSVVEIKRGRLTTTGLYGYVRHPSYSGAYLMFIGSTLLLQAFYTLAFTIIALFLAYGIRIRYEEIQLLSYYKTKYKKYQRKTWKLIPYLY